MEAALGFPASPWQRTSLPKERDLSCSSWRSSKLAFLWACPFLELLKARLMKEEPWCSNKGVLLGASQAVSDSSQIYAMQSMSILEQPDSLGPRAQVRQVTMCLPSQYCPFPSPRLGLSL